LVPDGANQMEYAEKGNGVGMACILLAEDDTALRTFLAAALERAGHEVSASGDGLDALEAFKQGTYDLLVADVVMPSLDGFQLASRARALHPELQVIFITGFAAVTLDARERELRGSKVLSKPFHLRELVDQVTDILKKQADAI
jgi:two-component system cell cycle response regulator CpdR